MKKILKENILLTISILSFLLLLIPVSIFLYNFRDNPISNNLSDWASFGDYIGGTINTILALSSLIILGLLTHNIGKQSNEENKNISLLLKRIDSYEQLAYFLTEVFTSVHAMTIKVTKIRKPGQTIDMINKIKEDIEKDAKVFLQFYSLLATFEQRYSYLYKYDFSLKEFQDLIDEAEKFTIFIDDLINKHDDEIIEYQDPKVINKLFLVLEKLQKELK
jgi:hypothetical protein